MNKEDWIAIFDSSMQKEERPEEISLHVYPSVTSTMDIARNILKGNYASDSNALIHGNDDASIKWIYALEQTSGRGRRNREWSSLHSGGMYFTLLDQTSRPVTALSGLSLAIGLGVYRSLTSYSGLECGLKWPNDILTKLKPHRKISGILIETLPSNIEGYSNLIIGVGLNINQQVFPSTIPATSLAIELGMLQEYEKICLNTASMIQKTYDEFLDKGFPALREEWWSSSLMSHCRVRCEHPSIEGDAVSVSDTGALQISNDGRLHDIISGDVEIKYDFMY